MSSIRNETFEVISVCDPAIDKSAMTSEDWHAYSSTRDTRTLKFLPGKEPTVFVIREVPHEWWESFVKLGSESRAREDICTTLEARRAFQAALVLVKNLHQPDGVSLPSFEPPREGNSAVMTDAALARFAPLYREEIGAVAYTHSFFPTEIAHSYPLLPGSRAALSALLAHHAAANPSSRVSSSNGALSPAGTASAASAPTDSATASSDNSTDDPTAATVPATH